VFEQQHFDSKAANFTDFEVFIPLDIAADSLTLVKLVQTQAKPAEDPKAANAQELDTGFKLEVQGVSETGDVIFLFGNE